MKKSINEDPIAHDPATSIIGHSATIAGLHKTIASERIHHTLLFTGPSGVGKKRVAKSLAMTFMCLQYHQDGSRQIPSFGGCTMCHHCKLMHAGNLPDLITVACDDKSAASTESVRELLNSLRLRPFAGTYRFLIFDDAHLLQGAAANALLKSLEEPRPGTFFILLTDKPHLMLRTIHSRAQRWGFHHLTNEELAKVLQANGEEVRARCVELASGSISSYSLIKEQGEELTALHDELKAIAMGDHAAALRLGSTFAQDRENLKEKIACLHLLARSEMLQTRQLCWANFIYELGEFEYYLLKRNFAPLYLFQNLFLHLAESFQDQFILEQDGLLESLIPS